MLPEYCRVTLPAGKIENAQLKNWENTIKDIFLAILYTSYFSQITDTFMKIQSTEHQAT